jgi:hypothetical protein
MYRGVISVSVPLVGQQPCGKYKLTRNNTDSLIVQELGAQYVRLRHVLLLGPEFELRTD